jgi:soluble cytochrome b562
MKSVKKYYISIIFLSLCSFVAAQPQQQAAPTQSALSPQDRKTVTEFEKNAKDYAKLREQLEEQLPTLPKDAAPEQIEAHKTAFQKLVQGARGNAKQGDIFTPAATRLIRKIIRKEYKGKDLAELREAVLEADTKGVPLKINFPYPDSKEQVEMTPRLLLNLPQLPKQLRFRFVGRSLLLLDRENGLIVDYMTDALP